MTARRPAYTLAGPPLPQSPWGGGSTLGYLLLGIGLPITGILIPDWFERRVGILVVLYLLAAGAYRYQSRRKRGGWDSSRDG